MNNMEPSSFLEVKVKDRSGKIAAYLQCSCVNGEVKIKSLFSEAKYRNRGLEESLMQRAIDFANRKKAASIIAYPGAEPYCRSGQMPKSKEIKFYQEQGFHIDHYIMGSPCMVKFLRGDTGSEA